jgi:hypothetical protein
MLWLKLYANASNAFAGSGGEPHKVMRSAAQMPNHSMAVVCVSSVDWVAFSVSDILPKSLQLLCRFQRRP